MNAIRFWRGRHLYQIAPAHEGGGYIGLCGGQIVATAPDAPSVMRALIMAARWRC